MSEERLMVLCRDCGKFVDCEETEDHTMYCNHSFVTLHANASRATLAMEQKKDLVRLGETQERLEMAGRDNDDIIVAVVRDNITSDLQAPEGLKANITSLATETRNETLLINENQEVLEKTNRRDVREDDEEDRSDKGGGRDRGIGMGLEISEGHDDYNNGADDDDDDKNDDDLDDRAPSWSLYSAICGPLPGLGGAYEFDPSGRLRHTIDGTKVSLEDLASSSSFDRAEGSRKHSTRQNHDGTPLGRFVTSKPSGDDAGRSRGRRRSQSSGSAALAAEVLLASETFIANALHRVYDIQRLEIPGPRSALHPLARNPIFVSHRWQRAKELLLIIPRPFGGSPLLWSRSLTIDRGLLHGSVIPLVHGARARGWGVVICNPGKNSVKVDVDPDGFAVRTCKIPIVGSETHQRHIEYIWDNLIAGGGGTDSSVMIVTHGYSEEIFRHLFQVRKDEVHDRVTAVALIDGWHTVMSAAGDGTDRNGEANVDENTDEEIGFERHEETWKEEEKRIFNDHSSTILRGINDGRSGGSVELEKGEERMGRQGNQGEGRGMKVPREKGLDHVMEEHNRVERDRRFAAERIISWETKMSKKTSDHYKVGMTNTDHRVGGKEKGDDGGTQEEEEDWKGPPARATSLIVTDTLKATMKMVAMLSASLSCPRRSNVCPGATAHHHHRKEQHVFAVSTGVSATIKPRFSRSFYPLLSPPDKISQQQSPHLVHHLRRSDYYPPQGASSGQAVTLDSGASGDEGRQDLSSMDLFASQRVGVGWRECDHLACVAIATTMAHDGGASSLAELANLAITQTESLRRPISSAKEDGRKEIDKTDDGPLRASAVMPYTRRLGHDIMMATAEKGRKARKRIDVDRGGEGGRERYVEGRGGGGDIERRENDDDNDDEEEDDDDDGDEKGRVKLGSRRRRRTLTFDAVAERGSAAAAAADAARSQESEVEDGGRRKDNEIHLQYLLRKGEHQRNRKRIDEPWEGIDLPALPPTGEGNASYAPALLTIPVLHSFDFLLQREAERTHRRQSQQLQPATQQLEEGDRALESNKEVSDHQGRDRTPAPCGSSSHPSACSSSGSGRAESASGVDSDSVLFALEFLSTQGRWG